MTWDEETHDDGSGDPWAVRTATTLKLTERLSMLLFIGAGLALVLGLVMAIGTYNAADGQLADAGGLFSSDSGNTFAIVQSMSYVAASLLPAGLLAAAAVALRLQAARFEADVLGS